MLGERALPQVQKFEREVAARETLDPGGTRPRPRLKAAPGPGRGDSDRYQVLVLTHVTRPARFLLARSQRERDARAPRARRPRPPPAHACTSPHRGRVACGQSVPCGTAYLVAFMYLPPVRRDREASREVSLVCRKESVGVTQLSPRGSPVLLRLTASCPTVESKHGVMP